MKLYRFARDVGEGVFVGCLALIGLVVGVGALYFIASTIVLTIQQLR